MAEQPSTGGFDFQNYLRTRDGKVRPGRKLPTIAQSDVTVSHSLPMGHSMAMHDLLMEHRIDGYDKPWVRAVKDIVNFDRKFKGHTVLDASEKHWNQMHLAMHDFNRAVLLAAAEAPNDPDHIPYDEAVVKYWGAIYRQIDEFHQAFPEQALTTLPTHEEFMAALPDLLEPLLAVAPPPAPTRESEQAALARAHGTYEPKARNEQPELPLLANDSSPITTHQAMEPSPVTLVAQVRHALEETPVPSAGFAWYADLQREYGIACTLFDEAIQHPGNDRDLKEQLSEKLDALMELNGSLQAKLDGLAEKLLTQRATGQSVAIDKRDFVRICSDYNAMRDMLPEHQQKHLFGGHQMRTLLHPMEHEAEKTLDRIIGPLPDVGRGR